MTKRSIRPVRAAARTGARTVGHVLGAEVLGSVEFGVDGLGCPLVAVLGHDSCGAVGAACAALEDGMVPSGTRSSW